MIAHVLASLTGASLMLAQDTPLHVVSEILGHASITITMDVYGETAAVVPRTTTSEIHRYKANATDKRIQARLTPEGQ